MQLVAILLLLEGMAFTGLKCQEQECVRTPLVRGKELPWLQHRLFGTMEGNRPTGATRLCKLEPSCCWLPMLLRGLAQHQELMAQEETHGPAVAAGLGLTPRAWEGHSETGRGSWRHTGHGLLGTGERGQCPSCPLGSHQHRLLFPAMWGLYVSPGLWDHLSVPGKAVSAGSLPSLSCAPSHISHHCCKTFPLSPCTAAQSSPGALSPLSSFPGEGMP